MGHLRPASLLCLGLVLRWRCKLDSASCRLPENDREHARQVTGDVVGSAGFSVVGEMEAWDIVVGEVVWLSPSNVYELLVSGQDIALDGVESRISAPLLVEDIGVMGSMVCCCRRITTITLVSGLRWTVGSFGCCLSKLREIFSTLSQSSM